MKSLQQNDQFRQSQTLNVLNNDAYQSMSSHINSWKNCNKCGISEFTHHHVFARGTIPCDILFIGEAPGKTEDLVGSPFVGQAGKILDNWIYQSCYSLEENKDINGVGDDVYVPVSSPGIKWAITNIISCRPCDSAGGGNRRPMPDEVQNCKPRLLEFLEIAKPSHIVFLGMTASKAGAIQLLVKGSERIQKERCLHLRHPAYFLHSDSDKAGGEAELEEIDRLSKFVDQVVILKNSKKGAV